MSTWILLRGLARERRHWGAFPALLRKEMPDIRVIALDLPGSGGLNDMTSPVNIQDMVEYCRSELVRHGVKPPYRMLAMSMGAMVATDWAQRHTQEIDACVLINTSFASFSTFRERLRPRAWMMLLKILVAPTAAYREALVLRLTSRLKARLGARSERVLDEWIAIRESRPVSAMNGLRQLVAAARFRVSDAAPAPTLILASAYDDLVHPRCSKEIARQWNCPIAMHSEAGHDLPLDDGAWVACKVREWIADTSCNKQNTRTGAAFRA